MFKFSEDFRSLLSESAEVVSVGVDWITGTGPSENGYNRVWPILADYTDLMVDEGQKLYRVARNGYRLSVIGEAQYGKRGEEWMVCLSGNLARKMWKGVALYSKNITRLDLQVTIKLKGYDGDEIKGVYTYLHSNSQERVRRNKTLIVGGDKGDTLYVGSRSSSQYGRLYDKAKQSKGATEWENCIRYEVEFKKPASYDVAVKMLDEDYTSEKIARLVLHWFDKRGIISPAVTEYGDDAIQIRPREVTAERQIRWLSEQVRGTYHQLHLAGFGVEADNALGIPELAQLVQSSQ